MSTSGWPRVIAHVDMDSFYASVEVRDRPSLRGRPVVVGGDSDRRGVVSSASYEARKFGVRSAMPMSQATRLCPDLVVLPGNMSKYATASRTLRDIFSEFSPIVEPLSLDEAFLDLTGSDRLLGSPEEIGNAIRRRIREELNLTGSVGMSVSKFVAKLASDYDKPDGLTLVPAERVVEFVQSLPLGRLWGVGPKTLQVLERAGVRTIAALAEADPLWLSRHVGSNAERLVALANGRDTRRVQPDLSAKSISHEVTFARDQSDRGTLEGVLLGMAENVARRARKSDVSGRTVTLKLRRPDFSTFTRRRTLASPTRDAARIFDTARDLYRVLNEADQPVRLIGLGIAGLEDAPQLELDLFDSGSERPGAEPRRQLQEAEDAISSRFGKAVLSRARTFLSESARDTGSLFERKDAFDEPDNPVASED